MTESGQKPGDYVRKVREDTHRYMQDLLEENKRLRRLVASLESDKARLEQERMRYREELLEARTDLEQFRAEQASLQRQLAEIEADNRRYSQEYSKVERENNNLANLYVASYRLHGTLDRSEILQAIQEIVINLIGSEEFIVFEVAPDGSRLRAAVSYGLDGAPLDGLRMGEGQIGKAAQTGERYFADSSDEGRSEEEAQLTACIPLALDGRSIGVLAIFSLLPQKEGFVSLDYELFDLLASQAAAALYLSQLRSDGAVRAGVARTGGGNGSAEGVGEEVAGAD